MMNAPRSISSVSNTLGCRSLGLCLALSLCAPIALPARAAQAQPQAKAPAAGASNNGSSSEYVQFRKAHDAMKAENWPEARRILMALWEKSESYDVAALLGQVEFKLGNYGLATRRMAFALDHIAPKEKPETRERLQAAFKEIRARAGSLRITTSAPNLRVFVDGEAVGSTPFSGEVYVDPGVHQVELRDALERPVVANRAVSASAGQVSIVELPAPGEVSGSPGANMDPTAAPNTSLPPQTLGPNETVAPPPERRKSPVPAYIAGGVAAAGLAVAVGFGVASRSSKNDAEEYRGLLGPSGCAGSEAESGECIGLRDANDSWRRDSRIANIGWAAFGVGVAAVGVWFLLPGPGREDATRAQPGPKLRASLYPTPQGGGLALGGLF